MSDTPANQPESGTPSTAQTSSAEPPPPHGPPFDGVDLDETLTSDERAVMDHAAAIPKDSNADLWAFAFDSPLRAQEALLAAMRMVARKQLTLEDAAIVAKVRGRVRVTQTKDVTPTQGAVGGAWLGILAGLFLGPGGPIVGAALGAAAGGLFAKLRDIGIDDDEMKRMGDELDDDEAALFLLVEDCHQMRALHEVSRFPGRLLASSADADLQETVRQRLAVDPWG
ncbi:MAG: DUF1269 domain-containing protein [Nitriliruptoraceae bacterium]